MIGIALYEAGPGVFWRCLAYLAVFHFVRQQYGWVMLYRARCGERGRGGRAFDAAVIYLATGYPLVYWHAHLPRRFAWFLPGDFAALPELCADLLAPVYWLALAAYAVRSAWQRFPNPGKDVVVATTAACWYAGIVWFDSDYAFTVTNVIIHGVPYFVLVYWYRWVRGTGERRAAGWHARTAGAFLAAAWVLAFAEELLWDKLVWHDRGWLFGDAWGGRGWRWLVVPLLALPQLTHYLLDGLVWRRRGNPGFTLGGEGVKG